MITTIQSKSRSGYVRYRQTIYHDENLNPKSFAAHVLLKDYLRSIDDSEEGRQRRGGRTRKNRNELIAFSRSFLTTQKLIHGKLTCSYCSKTNLEIEYEGMKIKRSKLATIDHVVPMSKGGAHLDPKNVVVACSRCNGRKGSKDLKNFLSPEEFVKFIKQFSNEQKNDSARQSPCGILS